MSFCVFQGTNIAAGKARGVVVGTGLSTEIGKSKLKVVHLYSAFQTGYALPKALYM